MDSSAVFLFPVSIVIKYLIYYAHLCDSHVTLLHTYIHSLHLYDIFGTNMFTQSCSSDSVGRVLQCRTCHILSFIVLTDFNSESCSCVYHRGSKIPWGTWILKSQEPEKD